jgi:hypothetical protein
MKNKPPLKIFINNQTYSLGGLGTMYDYGFNRVGGYRKYFKYIHKRDNGTCVYCGEKDIDFHLDHVIPQCQGGKNNINNLVLACKKCNMSKGGRTPEQWGKPWPKIKDKVIYL